MNFKIKSLNILHKEAMWSGRSDSEIQNDKPESKSQETEKSGFNVLCEKFNIPRHDANNLRDNYWIELEDLKVLEDVETDPIIGKYLESIPLISIITLIQNEMWFHISILKKNKVSVINFLKSTIISLSASFRDLKENYKYFYNVVAGEDDFHSTVWSCFINVCINLKQNPKIRLDDFKDWINVDLVKEHSAVHANFDFFGDLYKKIQDSAEDRNVDRELSSVRYNFFSNLNNNIKITRIKLESLTEDEESADQNKSALQHMEYTRNLTIISRQIDGIDYLKKVFEKRDLSKLYDKLSPKYKNIIHMNLVDFRDVPEEVVEYYSNSMKENNYEKTLKDLIGLSLIFAKKWDRMSQNFDYNYLYQRLWLEASDWYDPNSFRARLYIKIKDERKSMLWNIGRDEVSSYGFPWGSNNYSFNLGDSSSHLIGQPKPWDLNLYSLAAWKATRPWLKGFAANFNYFQKFSKNFDKIFGLLDYSTFQKLSFLGDDKGKNKGVLEELKAHNDIWRELNDTEDRKVFVNYMNSKLSKDNQIGNPDVDTYFERIRYGVEKHWVAVMFWIKNEDVRNNLISEWFTLEWFILEWDKSRDLSIPGSLFEDLFNWEEFEEIMNNPKPERFLHDFTNLLFRKFSDIDNNDLKKQNFKNVEKIAFSLLNNIWDQIISDYRFDKTYDLMSKNNNFKALTEKSVVNALTELESDKSKDEEFLQKIQELKLVLGKKEWNIILNWFRYGIAYYFFEESGPWDKLDKAFIDKNIDWIKQSFVDFLISNQSTWEGTDNENKRHPLWMTPEQLWEVFDSILVNFQAGVAETPVYFWEDWEVLKRNLSNISILKSEMEQARKLWYERYMEYVSQREQDKELLQNNWGLISNSISVSESMFDTQASEWVQTKFKKEDWIYIFQMRLPWEEDIIQVQSLNCQVWNQELMYQYFHRQYDLPLEFTWNADMLNKLVTSSTDVSREGIGSGDIANIDNFFKNYIYKRFYENWWTKEKNFLKENNLNIYDMYSKPHEFMNHFSQAMRNSVWWIEIDFDKYKIGLDTIDWSYFDKDVFRKTENEVFSKWREFYDSRSIFNKTASWIWKFKDTLASYFTR